MVKRSFYRGFITGGIILMITAGFVYNKYILTPDISVNQLEIEDLNGNIIDLASHEGKPLVINYWATWCAPCLKEFPHFEEAKNRFSDEIEFVMISDESKEKIISFSNSKPFSFNYVRSRKKLSEYGINEMTAVPTTYFYNASGHLIEKHTGTLSFETLYEILKRLK